MCNVLLPPGGNPIAINKYIISYIVSRLRDQWPRKRKEPGNSLHPVCYDDDDDDDDKYD